MKPNIISRMYDLDHRHYSFPRDSKLPRGTFDRPLIERAAEWAAVVICALALAGAILLFNTYLG